MSPDASLSQSVNTWYVQENYLEFIVERSHGSQMRFIQNFY